MDELTPEGTQALMQQTIELGRLLHSIAEKDPQSLPTPAACSAFRHWVEAAGPHSTDPRYFTDVLENYDVSGRCNRDLFDVFELLDPYLELEYIEDADDIAQGDKPRTFIQLPLG